MTASITLWVIVGTDDHADAALLSAVRSEGGRRMHLSRCSTPGRSTTKVQAHEVAESLAQQQVAQAIPGGRPRR